MKKLICLLMFSGFVNCFFAQSVNEGKISGEWILKKGWFDKEVIELERLDTSRHKSIGTKFSFLSQQKAGAYNIFDNIFSVNLYNPEKLGLCGNGLLYTEKGEWVVKDNLLILEIKGGYKIESEFHYKIEYEPGFKTDGRLVLTKKRVIKSEVKNYGS